MNQQNLDNLIVDYLQRMNDNEDFSINDCIIIVKLWNTVQQDELSKQKLFKKKFSDLFIEKYLDTVVKILGGQISKGMGYYCPEYDLYIGGVLHQKSQIKFDN